VEVSGLRRQQRRRQIGQAQALAHRSAIERLERAFGRRGSNQRVRARTQLAPTLSERDMVLDVQLAREKHR
jgi:hypothetical protein